MNKSRGRPRAGTDDGRERLLSAASTLFAAHGYHGATLRMIATEAGCDPALVAYHFGSKQALFARAMALSLSPSFVLAQALEGDPGTVAERLAVHVIRSWERPEVAQTTTRLVQTGMQHPEVLRAFREYVEEEVTRRLVEYLPGPAATERAAAIMTMVVGIVFGRYIVGIGPLRTMPPEKYLRALLPSLRAIPAQRPGRPR